MSVHTLSKKPSRRYGLLVLAGVGLLATSAIQVSAGSPPFSARDGLDLAADAALTWAEDARLIYIENDDSPSTGGSASQWGYLFASSSLEKYQVYAVEGGKIRKASDLGFVFDAPPLPDRWIDSGEAFLAAEEDGGTEFRMKEQGELSTMLLVRGVLHDKNPNRATWAFVYTATNAASLFVVVDAESGDVVRKWRG